MKKQKLASGFFPAFLLLFCICLVATLFMQGDDYVWHYALEYDELAGFRVPNGRYLSNTLSLVASNSVLLRWVVMLPLTVLFFLLTERFCVPEKSAYSGILRWTGFLLVILMPQKIFNDAFHWISAFPVYVLPIVLFLIPLMLFRRDLHGSPAEPRWALPLMLILGIAGALCAEHTTLCACLFAVFMLLYFGLSKGMKIRPWQIAYAIGTFAGAAVMFSNPSYRQIAAEGDQVGVRTIEFDFSDIFFQMYKYVIPYFARTFFLIHLVLLISLVVLRVRADASGWSKERRRYVRLCFGIACAYTAYTLFTAAFQELENSTPALRTSALEGAFVFLYLISLVYLFFVFLPRPEFVLSTVTLLLAFFSSAVFCVVNPVNMRCFFVDFCFWVLTAMTVMQTALRALPEKVTGYAERVLQLSSVTVSALLCYVLIVGKYAFELSVREVTGQFSNGIQKIELIETPYAGYTGSSLTFFLEQAARDPDEHRTIEQDPHLFCINKYYGWQMNLDKFDVRTITFFDYFM